jgi:CPA2 family monovalent cation:H+ antiporter-2
VIAQVGVDTGSISSDLYSLVLTTAVLTMSLTPFASRLAPALYGRWRERFPRDPLRTFNLPDTGLRDHVVILGHGRVGTFVARLLHRLEQTFVVVDVNPERVDAARDLGFPTLYGDVAADPVLEAAGAGKARLVIVTVPDALSARLAVESVRRINPDVHVVARSATEAQLEELGRLGVYEAVQPEFEAGLELGRQALSHLGIGAGEIQRFSDQVRRELYAPMAYGTGGNGDLHELRRASRMIETDWISLAHDSPFVGRTIGDLRVRSEMGASVVAIVRGEGVLANPGPDAAFAPGDTVGVLGTPDQRAAFLALAHGWPSGTGPR